MLARQTFLPLLSLVLTLAGCGAATPRTERAGESALGVVAGARLFFEAGDEDGRDLTVDVEEVAPQFSFELACGRIEAGAPLEHPTAGSVNTATLAEGRNVYSVASCDAIRERDGDSLPMFLVSRRIASALERRERTTLRREHQDRDLALMPVGRETIEVRVDGREVAIETVHARGDGLDLWIATGDTPIVVRMRDDQRTFTLAEVDTGSGPRARRTASHTHL